MPEGARRGKDGGGEGGGVEEAKMTQGKGESDMYLKSVQRNLKTNSNQSIVGRFRSYYTHTAKRTLYFLFSSKSGGRISKQLSSARGEMYLIG